MNRILLAAGFLAFVGVAWLLVGAPGKDRISFPDTDDMRDGLTGIDVKMVDTRLAANRTVTNDNALMQKEENTPVAAPDALSIETLREGTGDAVSENGDTLNVHYVGHLLDGTKFDSSRDRSVPFSFTLGGGQVIAGWDQGMLGMKVGESRKLTIPASLGYGSRGAGNIIPPNATLVFEVELLSIN